MTRLDDSPIFWTLLAHRERRDFVGAHFRSAAMNNRWHRCNPQSQDDRLRQYHARLGLTEEELLRRQAIGMRVRERMVDRAFQIPRHRSLVVVEQPRRKRRARA